MYQEVSPRAWNEVRPPNQPSCLGIVFHNTRLRCVESSTGALIIGSLTRLPDLRTWPAIFGIDLAREIVCSSPITDIARHQSTTSDVLDKRTHTHIHKIFTIHRACILNPTALGGAIDEAMGTCLLSNKKHHMQLLEGQNRSVKLMKKMIHLLM